MRYPRSRPCRSGSAFLVMAFILFSVLCAAGSAGGETTSPSSPGEYDRPDKDTIHSEVKDILSQPRFNPQKTIGQRFREWLSSLYRGWNPMLGLGTVASWFILIFGGLTLLAILAHLIWTIVIMFGGRSGSKGLSWLRSGGEPADAETYDKLYARMRELSKDGKYREAVGVMMLALVRWLDSVGAVSYHQSKTSGDYVREFPSAFPGRGNFRDFTISFDSIAYGGRPCSQDEYEAMSSSFEQVQADAKNVG